MSFKGQIYTPPPTSGWSFFNQSSSTATTIDKNAINIYMPKHGTGGSDNFTGYYRTPANSTPYTVIANVTYNSADVQLSTSTFLLPGLGFTDGTSIEFTNARVLDTGFGLTVLYAANSTTGSANQFNNQPAAATPYPWPSNQWFMIRDDGTNISYWISNDDQNNGSSWVKLFSSSRTNNFTHSKIGFFWGAQGRVDMNVTLNSWLELAI